MANALVQSKLLSVVRVISGNFLEMFDFFLFGLYATYIAKAFFPAGSEFGSLLLTFMTFGAGFLMRPLGAIILGPYVDRVGRRKGLVVSLSIMAIGTVLVSFCPTYATIGLFAPIIVVVGRLLQGFSAGVELAGVSVYLAEIATPGNKGFYVGWQSASQSLAVMAAALLGYLVSSTMQPEDIASWGWRVPFFVGCLVVPLVLILRRSLQETEAFLSQKRHPTTNREVLHSMASNWQTIPIGMLLVMMTAVSFYLIAIYTPTFGKNVLKLSEADSLIVTFAIGLSNFIWVPAMGALSDRLGRTPLLITFTVLTIFTAFPIMSWLVAEPTFLKMLVTLLWLSFLFGGYNGAMIVTLTELVPVQQRTATFSLAYGLAVVFGGFTPAISTALIEVTGNKASPALWMSFAAACSLAAALAIHRRLSAEAATIEAIG